MSAISSQESLCGDGSQTRPGRAQLGRILRFTDDL
jgi:hypothetical protein